ncbi:hypothetical protein NliqN6_2747 [Naganishia liquefaciens]|uniref:Uncharacterized protein n=1 Tax=Naganishia liquefaciens TaxID=104408 RepID=A0A8H3TSD7_9TREE|nr:hypothetical protein NliqN6_2747 [Naganishia liquefaciens]
MQDMGRADHTGSAKPRIRWWLPGTRITYKTLTRQLESLKEAGFGGVEVAFLGNGGDKPGLQNVDKWGDRDGKSKRMIKYIWSECKRLSLSADLTIGPAFPAMVPGLSADAAGSAKELVYGISQTYAPGEVLPLADLPVPMWQEAGRTPANPADQMAKLNLIAAYAVRVTTDFDGLTVKDNGSMIIAADDDTFGQAVLDITSQAKDQVDFPLPLLSGIRRNWVLLAVYYRGTLQVTSRMALRIKQKLTPLRPQSKSHFEQNADTYTQDLAHVVDHLSEDGVNVLAAYYKKYILDDELMLSFKQSMSSLFEDSLELSQTQYWTPALLREFEDRRGYALTPYLPLILDEPKHHPFAPPFKTFKLPRAIRSARTLQERVRYDFALTVSDLFLDRRLDPLKRWSNSIGLALRNQPYGIDFDAALAATKVDIVEGETLCFWGNDDSFRVLATGRDVSGSKILSEELAANMHKHYALGWHDIIRMANRDFALGVNQVILHGMPYPDSEHSEWPGYMPFMPAGRLPGFGDAWGERQPQWHLSRGYTRYLQNVQQVMQQGRAIVDLAIYHSAVEGVKGGLESTALTEAGYTYGFPSDGLLAREDAVVRNGKLWADGPGYKALILNEVKSIPQVTLRRILDLSRQGLPIIFVAKTPVCSAGLDADDSAIQKLVQTILEQNQAIKVDSLDDVASALGNLGIEPSILCTNTRSPLLSACREDGTARYYYIHNTADTPVESILTFNVSGYTSTAFLSLWEQAQPISEEDVAYGLYSKVPISLPAKASTIVRLVKSSGARSDAKTASCHTSIVSEILIESWQIHVQSWEPPPKGSTRSSDVQLHSKKFELEARLPGWQDVQGLQNVSGTAVYRTTFECPLIQESSQGGLPNKVVVEFEPITDAHQWFLNGSTVPGSDRLSGRLDLTSCVKEGKNVLELKIATTLTNRMRKVYPQLFKNRAAEQHGVRSP